MRVKLQTKVVIALATLVVVNGAAAFAVFASLGRIDRAAAELAHVEQPLSAAAYEMEVNLNGLALATHEYVQSRDPQSRAAIAEDTADFRRHHASYVRLCSDARERIFAAAVERLYDRFEVASGDLVAAADRLHHLSNALLELAEELDDELDGAVARLAERDDRGAMEMREAFTDVEAELAESVLWLVNYRRMPLPQHQERIAAHLDELSGALAHLPRALDPANRPFGEQIVARCAAFTEQLAQTMVQLEEKRAITSRLTGLRAEIDAVLDDELQTLAARTLNEPLAAVADVSRVTALALKALLPLVIVAHVAFAAWIIRQIRNPMRELLRGTSILARGQLLHRLPIHGQDEFAELSEQINRMAGELEATTVSKARLLDEIEQRRKAEAERERLQASLRRSEVLAAMGRLVAGVAHEVRNPLFAISSTVEAFVARFGNEPERQRYVEVLRRESARLTALTKALLDFGKPSLAEGGRCSVDAVACESLEACQEQARSAGVTVDARGTSGIEVAVDPHRLRQVVENLLQNAIQHAPRGSAVELRLRRADADPRCAELTIADRGPGFAAADLPRLFEPFFTRRQGGTGLGLAIVERIVEELGGTIEAANRADGGAQMTVRLPQLRAPADQGATA